MKLQTPFWYESNSCWGWVTNTDELKEKIKFQLEENNGILNIDDFLDLSRQNINDSLDFGTRGEHYGDKTLREFLEEQDFKFDEL